MAKKCIPGVICIENMTLFVLIVMMLLVIYMIYTQRAYTPSPTKVVVMPPSQNILDSVHLGPVPLGPVPLATVSSRMNDPYSPPLKTNGYVFRSDSSDIRGVPAIPINMETRGTGMAYQQIGILTPTNGSNELILPLMGRKLMNGRDKWQYYTIANGSGNINTKLPVSINGRSCTGEYGCDEIYNGSSIYVEGYKEVFTATVYENSTFSYIPYI